jgi:hypothetical protein
MLYLLFARIYNGVALTTCWTAFRRLERIAQVVSAAISQPNLQLLGFVEKSLRDHRRIPLKVVLRP